MHTTKVIASASTLMDKLKRPFQDLSVEMMADCMDSVADEEGDDGGDFSAAAEAILAEVIRTAMHRHTRAHTASRSITPADGQRGFTVIVSGSCWCRVVCRWRRASVTSSEVALYTLWSQRVGMACAPFIYLRCNSYFGAFLT